MQSSIRCTSFRLLWLFMQVVLVSCPAMAQFPPGGQPPAGGFPGGPPGMGGGAANDALINAPIEALAYGLKLSASQKANIARIQAAVHKQVDGMMPAPNGGMPDFQKLQASFAKIRQIDSRETKRIEALLTPAQKKGLPSVLKDIQTLSAAGIPAALMGELALTSDQKRRLQATAQQSQKEAAAKMKDAQQDGDFEAMRSIMESSRKQTETRAMSLLTAGQKSLVEGYRRSHPRPAMGGSGGPPPGM